MDRKGTLQLAETEGFEPSVREFPVRRFSKPLVSATHPRLRRGPESPRLYARCYIGQFSPLQPERRLFGDHVEPGVKLHLRFGIEHAKAELGPALLRLVQRGIGMGHRFG